MHFLWSAGWETHTPFEVRQQIRQALTQETQKLGALVPEAGAYINEYALILIDNIIHTDTLSRADIVRDSLLLKLALVTNHCPYRTNLNGKMSSGEATTIDLLESRGPLIQPVFSLAITASDMKETR
jgi:hypothetical protein